MAQGNGGERGRRLPARTARLLVLAVILLIAAVIGYSRYRIWRNDGIRYAEKLSTQIGLTQGEAEKAAKMKFVQSSQYNTVTAVGGAHAGFFESSYTVQVNGASVPEWLICADLDGERICQVILYNYKQLGSSGIGTKRSVPMSADLISQGMLPDAVQDLVGFKPVRVSYAAGSMQEVYKYYIRDEKTGNQNVYLFTVNYQEGGAVSVTPSEDQTLYTILTP